ncbi:MAG: D-aminoacyl-tRNA deacylase [Clostridia bacterium]
MKAVVQIVRDSCVKVSGKIVGQIDFGLLVLFGVEDQDTLESVEKLADKIVKMRIFKDENDKINKNVTAVGGKVLVVSNFTLLADCTSNRPSFCHAGNPEHAKKLWEHLVNCINKNVHCEKGEFGADMLVSQTLLGPMTFVL